MLRTNSREVRQEKRVHAVCGLIFLVSAERAISVSRDDTGTPGSLRCLDGSGLDRAGAQHQWQRVIATASLAGRRGDLALHRFGAVPQPTDLAYRAPICARSARHCTKPWKSASGNPDKGSFTEFSEVYAQVIFNFAGRKFQHLSCQGRLHPNPEGVVHHVVGVRQVAADTIIGTDHIGLAGQIAGK